MALINPSSFLPRLMRGPIMPLEEISSLLHRLQLIYDTTLPSKNRYCSEQHTELASVKLSKGFNVSTDKKQSKAVDIVIDSGYASEEDFEEDVVSETAEVMYAIRSDAMEKAFVVRWLTSFVAKFSMWMDSVAEESEGGDAQEDSLEDLVEQAAELLAICSGQRESNVDVELTRKFHFQYSDPSSAGDTLCMLDVELNDAPLLANDHSSVGLQSWSSSIVLTRMMCRGPGLFDLEHGRTSNSGVRVLELGAGTGLCSISVAKLLAYSGRCATEIIATDYHPEVLANLRRNVQTNFACDSPPPVGVRHLDWQSIPNEALAPFDEPFDVIIGADIIYQSQHAQWVKDCVRRCLRRPSYAREDKVPSGVFWLIMPIRAAGRHEGHDSSVQYTFQCHDPGTTSKCEDLDVKIIRSIDIEKVDGVGRADETGYKLFEIRWV